MVGKTKAAGAKAPAATKEKSFSDYFQELELLGKTSVPCPHGHGTYTISTSGCHWYHTPEIIFKSSPTCPKPWNDQRWGGSSFSVHGGRIIAWYPSWAGRTYRPSIDGAAVNNLRLAKMLVRIILSGRRLYLLKCGQNISSLDTDEDKISEQY